MSVVIDQHPDTSMEIVEPTYRLVDRGAFEKAASAPNLGESGRQKIWDALLDAQRLQATVLANEGLQPPLPDGDHLDLDLIVGYFRRVEAGEVALHHLGKNGWNIVATLNNDSVVDERLFLHPWVKEVHQHFLPSRTETLRRGAIGEDGSMVSVAEAGRLAAAETLEYYYDHYVAADYGD